MKELMVVVVMLPLVVVFVRRYVEVKELNGFRTLLWLKNARVALEVTARMHTNHEAQLGPTCANIRVPISPSRRCETGLNHCVWLRMCVLGRAQSAGGGVDGG